MLVNGSPRLIAHRLAVPWIVRLRYGIIAGEIALIGTAWLGLGVSLPLSLLVACVALQCASNWALPRWSAGEHLVGSLFCFDAVCLTLILAWTGGPANPFTLLYLVQITFSAVILNKAWTWVLGVLSSLSFGLLFWVSQDVPALGIHVPLGQFSLHLFGMWLAFATAALLISFFIGRVSAEVRKKEEELRAMQDRLARNERLASLVTLAAGAAHEIATPLSTIAVTAKEIERHAVREAADSRVEEDARLIRSQVERCRLILERMAAQGADPLGEAPKVVNFAQLFERVRDRFPSERSRIDMNLAADLPQCALPENAAVEALSALVKNALDASPDGKPVVLQAAPGNGVVCLRVRDQGTGMTPEVMDRVLEPFFTTKPTGKGMGLGVFLVHVFTQRLGGRLSFESQPGKGCCVLLEFPVTPNV